MFEKLKGKGLDKEDKKDLDKEKRVMAFNRERDTFRAAAGEDYANIVEQDRRSDLLRWQQDLDDELEKLKHRLRGEYFDSEHGWIPKRMQVKDPQSGEMRIVNMPPLSNEFFIDRVETLAEPFLSRNMINSNFTETRILKMLLRTSNAITDSMADNYDLFGIDFMNYTQVLTLIKSVITPGPFRALNNGQRIHDRTMGKRIESLNDNPIQEKKKALGVFN